VNQHFADQPLLAAEIAYMRYPRDEWELLLARMRQLGANTIAVPVRWSWHAPRPGIFELGGHSNPQRDLLGFVQLCDQLGLRVLLKLDSAGAMAPEWLIHAHPEVRSLHADGQFHPSQICALHPAYLAALRGWLAALSAHLLPLQAPKGPITALWLGAVGSRTGEQPTLDCSPYVTSELWPRWLRETRPAGLTPSLEQPASALPAEWTDPQHGDTLEAFASWMEATAASTLIGWLREAGWTTPLGAVAPARGAADLPALAATSGWIGYRSAAPEANVAEAAQNFAAYVRSAHWSPRLVRQLSPGLPAFASVEPLDDLVFAAPLVGGLQGLNIAIDGDSWADTLDRWSNGAVVRPDGSVRPRFWRARVPVLLLGAAAANFAVARGPADLAVGFWRAPNHPAGGLATGRTQTLVQQLVQANIAFDLLDLDLAAPKDLERYAMVLTPDELPREVQDRLGDCDNLTLVGEANGQESEQYTPHNPHRQSEPRLLRMSEPITDERLGELAAARGGMARYAWADAEDVDVSIRYGGGHTFLFIANRRPSPYNGLLSYRAPDRSIQHVHIGLGSSRVGVVLIKDDEVLGAAIGGDAAEGGWLARGLHSSIVFNNGAGMVAPCGTGLLLSAAHSGRFQVRRPAGWQGLEAWRLLLNGTLLPADFQTDGVHVGLPYIAEDERGQTDMYLLLPAHEPLPRQPHEHTATLLRARALSLQRAAQVSNDAARTAGTPRDALALAAEEFVRAADGLEMLAERSYSIEDYGAAWEAASAICRSPTAALAQAHEQASAATTDLAAGPEELLARILGTVTRWGILQHPGQEERA
jgi:hypothetical protein